MSKLIKEWLDIFLEIMGKNPQQMFPPKTKEKK